MSTLPDPVIFLPGIMGSALRDEYPVDPDTVWSPWKLLIKSYERITLHPDDTRFELHEPARVARDQVFAMIYGEIIEELRHNLTQKADEPVPVFPFAYDWRKPLEQVEAELAKFVEEVTARTSLLRHYNRDGYRAETGKVNLVAHSMGGLIAAGYVATDRMKRVRRVATLATPFRGSLEAVAKTSTGVGALGLSPGSSREREAARVTPSLYHLLPSYAGAVKAAPKLSADLFQAESWQQSILDTLAEFVRMYGVTKADDPKQRALELMRGMLDAARQYRQRVDTLALPDTRDWLCVVGADAKTRVDMKIAKGPYFQLGDEENRWSEKTERMRTGDNTVPLEGALPDFLPRNEVVVVIPEDFGTFEFGDKLLARTGFHSSIPSMNLAQRLVISHLRGKAWGDIWGRPLPGVTPKQWKPPLQGLKAKS